MNNEMNHGIVIKIFIPDGSPSGVWVVERESDWNGSVVVCPRACFKTARSTMEQFDEPGIYILRGQSNQVEPTIYIGEGDPVKNRLDSHDLDPKKDFWEDVFICVSDGGKLNKAHIQHIESRLVVLAKMAKRCKLDQNTPQLPTLSKSDLASVENYLTKLRFVLRVLGLNIFDKPDISTTEVSSQEAPSNLLFLKNAKGCFVSGKFVVLAKSEVALQTVAQASEGIIARRKSLEASGVLKAENGSLVFSQDYEFNSPSTAAEVVLGRSANGRIEWKNDQGKSIKVLDAEAVKSI